MPFRRRCLVLLAVVACSSEPGPVPTGTIRISVTTAGQRLDPDGYRAIVDDTITGALATTDATEFTGLAAGSHAIRLADIAPNCTPDWYAPQPVDLEAGGAVDVAFTVMCAVPLTGRIVFSSQRDNGYRNVYSMAANGSDVKRLTTFASIGDDQPQLSPGGTRIVFMRYEGAPGTGPIPDLWIMNADGSGQSNLTNSPGVLEEQPHWSPDGTKLVFIRWGQERELVIASADGRRDSVVYSSTLPLGGPAWSPDGAYIAFTQSDEIRLLSLATGAVRVVVKDMLTPTWTPLGDRITAASADRLVNILPDGTDPQVLLAGVSGAITPAWSRDGTRLAFLGWGPGGLLHIFTASGAGADLTDLSTGSDYSDFSPSWSP